MREVITAIVVIITAIMVITATMAEAVLLAIRAAGVMVDQVDHSVDHSVVAVMEAQVDQVAPLASQVDQADQVAVMEAQADQVAPLASQVDQATRSTVFKSLLQHLDFGTI